MTAPLTQLYAKFVSDWANWSSVPTDSLAVARLGFTDCVGVMLAGQNEEAVGHLRVHVTAQGGKPVARMVGSGTRVSPVQAALVNATAAHALDYDDFAFSNHPSAVLVPTILAAADAHGASGHQMALAYLAGYEVWADLMLREKDLYYDKGWHPTAVLGPVGAAAAAAVAMGLNPTQTCHALALAASDSGGVFENFGTMAKPYHGGRAAAAGLSAASMALCGMEASAAALEGKHGLMQALSPRGQVDLARLPKLGAEWRSATLRLNIKKYPVVGAAQRGIDAVLGLKSRHAINPWSVAHIAAHVSERHAAVMPYHLPQNALQAKFSLEFAIASALVHNAVGFDQLQDSIVTAPLIQQSMSRVKIHTTAEFEPEWRDAAPFDVVHFVMDDGRTLSSPQVRRATGHADTPLSLDALRRKFNGCTEQVGLADAASNDLFHALQRVDTLSSAQEIQWSA